MYYHPHVHSVPIVVIIRVSTLWCVNTYIVECLPTILVHPAIAPRCATTVKVRALDSELRHGNLNLPSPYLPCLCLLGGAVSG